MSRTVVALPGGADGATPARPEPEREFPKQRRAVFFDVENTGSTAHIARVVDHLRLDRSVHRTDLIAVGNWKVVSQAAASLLAYHGAALLHSAPAIGVQDWTDLRIAVSAGMWLARARPGDLIDIISDDRAFDAVGDVAAGFGITFRRLSYRRLRDGLQDGDGAAPDGASGARGRRREGGRRRADPRRPRVTDGYSPRMRQAAPQAPTGAGHVDRERATETAPHVELVAVARDLAKSSPSGAVTLDALANALKSRGFRRTPGSPRLITQLRRLSELAVTGSGLITLRAAGAER